MHPLLRRRVGMQGFDPRSIAGLKLWLKADAIAGLADGAGIASWPDSSGNGVSTTQATGVNQPTYKVGIINRMPVARGVAGTTGFATTLADAAVSHSAFTVCNPTGTTGYLLDAATGRLIVSPLQGSVASKIAYFDGAWHDIAASLTGSWQVCSWVLDSAANLGQVWRNGVSLGTSTYAGKAIGGSTGLMEFNSTATLGFIGDVAEVLIYTGALSAGNRALVESYLNRKYHIY